MKKYNKIVLLLSAGLLTLSSCNLDLEPTTSIAYSEGTDMIQDAGTLTRLANGMNQSYRSTFYGQMLVPSELMLDGFNATISFGNNYGGVHRMDATFTSSDYDTEALWAGHYTAIKNYNIFISEVAKYITNTADADTESANLYDGYAHFYRASSYLELIRHFAKAYNSSSAASDLGVPLILEWNQEEKPARASVQAVYDQIKADLDYAAGKLAGVTGTLRALTPTIDAVNALYARYYIDTKNYTQAAAYSKKVIDSSAGYALASDADGMKAEYTNDNGTEPIMQLAATLSENGSGTNSDYTRTSSDKAFAAYGSLFFQSYFLPSQKLIDLYEENDLRLNQWFNASIISYLEAPYLGEWYTFTRYLGNPELTSNGVPNSRQHVKPLLIAEQYLINAEANFYAGNTADAKESLNYIQASRGATETDATKQAIENEWFKETIGEGLRYSCLKRWGQGFSGRPGQTNALLESVLQEGDAYTGKVMTADDIHWAWPVPSYEMRVNDNLVQNPGY